MTNQEGRRIACLCSIFGIFRGVFAGKLGPFPLSNLRVRVGVISPSFITQKQHLYNSKNKEIKPHQTSSNQGI
jgi:hypothetical protein